MLRDNSCEELQLKILLGYVTTRIHGFHTGLLSWVGGSWEGGLRVCN